MYTYIEIIPEKFTELQWRAYYRLREDLHLLFDDPITVGFENFKKVAVNNINENGFSIYILMRETEMVGYLRYWITNPGHANAQNNIVACFIPEKYMDKKMELTLANCLKDKLKKEGHTKCLWRSSQGHILQLIKKLGGKKSNSGAWFKLHPKKIEKKLIDQWLHAVDPLKLGLTVREETFIPEELLEQTAKISTELINDMVREDDSLKFHLDTNTLKVAQENFKRSESKPVHLILMNKNDQIIGMSLVVVHKESTIAEQRITGVVKGWRGKGLAKWLKAKVISILLKDFDQVNEIKTECFSTNAPMIQLNKALGYELYRTDHDFYIYLNSLESFLKGN